MARTTRNRPAVIVAPPSGVDKISTLPTEILAIIVKLLPHQTRELAQLVLVSKQFYAVAAPLLYRQVTRSYVYRPPYGKATGFKNSLASKHCAVWRTLHKNPSLGAHVRDLELNFHDMPKEEEEALCTAIQTELKLSPNVRQLHVPRPTPFDNAVAQVAAEAELTSTLTELRWTYSGPGVDALLQAAQSTLRTLRLYAGKRPTVDWTASPPLSGLALETLDISSTLPMYKSWLNLPTPHFLAIATSSLSTLRSLALSSHLLLALENQPLPLVVKLRVTLDSEGIANPAAVAQSIQQCPELRNLTIDSPHTWHRMRSENIYTYPPPAELLLGLPKGIRDLDLTGSGVTGETLIQFAVEGKIRSVHCSFIESSDRELRKRVREAFGLQGRKEV